MIRISNPSAIRAASLVTAAGAIPHEIDAALNTQQPLTDGRTAVSFIQVYGCDNDDLPLNLSDPANRPQNLARAVELRIYARLQDPGAASRFYRTKKAWPVAGHIELTDRETGSVSARPTYPALVALSMECSAMGSNKGINLAHWEPIPDPFPRALNMTDDELAGTGL